MSAITASDVGSSSPIHRRAALFGIEPNKMRKNFQIPLDSRFLFGYLTRTEQNPIDGGSRSALKVGGCSNPDERQRSTEAMLSEFRIRRLVSSGHFSQLIDELAHNGRPLGLPVRIRLGDPAIVRPAALGLAIRRMTEITFAVVPTTRQLVEKLLGEQDPQTGGFGSIAASAVALRALFETRDQCGAGDLVPTLDRAIGPALQFLALAQDESGMLGDAIDSMIARWQLSACEPARQAIRWQDLVESSDAMPISSETASLLEAAA